MKVSSLCAGTLVLCLLPLSTTSAQSRLDKLKQAVTRKYTVRGRLQVQSGEWLTCFDGIKTGYLGSVDMAGPGDAKTDPTTGAIKVTTAAIPNVILTRKGVVTSNDCDSLAEQQLLIPDLPAGSRDTGYKDAYGCTKPEWTSDEIVRRRHEIMECQSEAITERAWQRSQARNGSAPAASSTGGQQAANTKLQEETAEKFKAIQAQAAVPVTTGSQNEAQLARDGATLCRLKPEYMLKLKGDAVAFVRYDAGAGKIVLSEMAGGERTQLSVDPTAFAQRIMFNAQAIGQGGDTCGRAFWNAEAYKAASAALSGGK